MMTRYNAGDYVSPTGVLGTTVIPAGTAVKRTAKEVAFGCYIALVKLVEACRVDELAPASPYDGGAQIDVDAKLRVDWQAAITPAIKGRVLGPAGQDSVSVEFLVPLFWLQSDSFQ